MLSGEKYIISSGGQTRQTATGGIAVIMKNGDLLIEVRIMFTSRKWLMNLGEIVNQPVVPACCYMGEKW